MISLFLCLDSKLYIFNYLFHQKSRKIGTIFDNKCPDTYWQYLFLCSEDISQELFASFTHTEKCYVDVGWDANVHQR